MADFGVERRSVGRGNRVFRRASRALSALCLTGIVFALTTNPNSVAIPEYSDWSAPVSLGPVINSAYSDGGPAISKDGLSLFFHSNRPGGFGSFDLYVSHREDMTAPWESPVNLGPTINTGVVETVPALSRDEHWLYFNSLNRPGGFGNFDIWASYRENIHDDLAWQAPVNLGPGVNTAFGDAGAGYFENVDAFGVPHPLLYFNSNRPGGFGGPDIYVSAQQPDGTWGPANHVEELSSPAGDQRPAVRFDGLELFLFRADPNPAVINDAELYVSTRKAVSDPWSPPVHLGFVVNGPLDDVRAYIGQDRMTLFFESGPNEPFGDMDMFMSTRSRDKP